MPTEQNVLAIYYTQSGQLGEMVAQFTEPLVRAGVQVETIRIYPEQDYDFPWTSERFFDAMPETVLSKTVALKPFSLKHQQYDLIIFAYQPWYLNLSIPANSMLQDPSLKRILKDTPVVTLIGARNMWLHAQQNLKDILKGLNAKLVGNVALVDRHANLISVVTILYWMMTGKKDKYLGIFPKPGVSDEDIRQCTKFGEVVCTHLQNREWKNLQPELIKNGAVEIDADLMFVEERAPRLFTIWANLISGKKNRKAWLVAFKYYLLIALFLVAPIVLLINRIFFRPFFRKKIAEKMKIHQGVNC